MMSLLLFLRRLRHVIAVQTAQKSIVADHSREFFAVEFHLNSLCERFGGNDIFFAVNVPRLVAKVLRLTAPIILDARVHDVFQIMLGAEHLAVQHQDAFDTALDRVDGIGLLHFSQAEAEKILLDIFALFSRLIYVVIPRVQREKIYVKSLKNVTIKEICKTRIAEIEGALVRYRI